MKAVVVGATGLVGKELVRLLLNEKRYQKVIVIARKRLSVVHPRLEQHLIQFEELDQCSSQWFESADVFCTLGTTIKKAKTKEQFKQVDYHYVVELGKLAMQYKARKMLVVTAMGANEGSVIFYNKVKGMTESELLAMSLPQLIIVKPSLIIGERHEFRFGEAVAAKFSRWLSFVFQGKMKKYKPNHVKDIAMALLKLSLMCKDKQKIVPAEEIIYWSRMKV